MNFIKVLIIGLIVLPLHSFAVAATASESTPTVKEGYKELDLSEIKNSYKNINLNSTSSSLKVSTGCKTKSGVESKVGDSNYDACVFEARQDISKGNKNGATQSIEFSTGK